jgi:hypothetical protein
MPDGRDRSLQGSLPKRRTQGERPLGGGLFPSAGQCSLGSKMVLLMKDRVISTSGKSVDSLSARRSGKTELLSLLTC